MDIEDHDPVGIVHVDISSLDFENDIDSREIDERDVNRLEERFKHGCFQDAALNQIPAFIMPADLDRLLQASQLTRADLQTSLLRRPYPKLNLGQEKLYCRYGRHRLKAAERVLTEPEDCWWTIQLISFEPGNIHSARSVYKLTVIKVPGLIILPEGGGSSLK
jgi:hypothetical protein